MLMFQSRQTIAYDLKHDNKDDHDKNVRFIFKKTKEE